MKKRNQKRNPHKISLGCVRMKDLLNEKINLEPCFQFLLLGIVIPNTIFDTTALLTLKYPLKSQLVVAFVTSIGINMSTFVSLQALNCIILKKKALNHNLSAILTSFHLLGILISSLERAIALDNNEQSSAIGQIWCSCMFSTVLDLICTWDAFEKYNLKLVKTFLGVLYLLARTFSVWELKYLLLLYPVLTNFIKRRFINGNKLCSVIRSGELNEKQKGAENIQSTEFFKSSGNKEFPQLSTKKVEIDIEEKSCDEMKSKYLLYEKLLRITSDAYLILAAEEEFALYLNKSAEKLLGSDSKQISDALKLRLFISPLIKQDEKVHPVMPDNSFNSINKGIKISNNNIQANEAGKNENSVAFNSSISNFSVLVNESLGCAIEKIKTNIKNKTSKKNNGVVSYDLSKKGNRYQDLIEEDESRENTPREKTSQKLGEEIILRANFLVEWRGLVQNLENSTVTSSKKLFEVELTFFEGSEFSLPNASSKLLYLIKMKDIEAVGILQKMQRDIDSFKENFISTLSHELKTPLNCSINMLEMLEYEMIQDEERYSWHLEKLQPALNNSKLLVSNINDIIDYSELISNKFVLRPTKFCISQLLIKMIALISDSAKQRGNNIRLEYEKKVGEFIISDEQRVSQVVLNLLSNANKYTFHGEITVKVEWFIDKYAKIKVKDSGCGIKEKEIKNIGVMGRTKGKKLIGMGLTIANYIASVLSPPDKRGIFVRSRIGKGSEFSFYVDNLQEYNLKRLTFFKQNNSPETFDQVSLVDLMHFQNTSRSSNKGSNSQTGISKVGEFDEHIGSDSHNISQSESLKKEDQDVPGGLMKIMASLSSHNKTMKFFQSLHDSGIKNQILGNRIDLNGRKNSSEENSLKFFSREDQSLQESKLFSQQHSVPLKFGKTNQNNQPFHENGAAGDKANYSAEEKLQKVLENRFETFGVPINQTQSNRWCLKEIIEELRKSKSCHCPELLIVDDNGYNLMVLRLMIESLGLKTDLAGGGDEAVSLVKSRLSGTKCRDCMIYNIVLMDIDMPEKDGIQTTAEILEIFENIKIKPVVIACTAFHESEFGQKCYSVGMRDFISKPIKRDLLEKVLLEHLETFLKI